MEEDALNTRIGGTVTGEGNLIAFNGMEGIGQVTDPAASTGTTILQNSIHSNGGLGIDLGDDGVTPNDAGDADTGPNNLQNFPSLFAATSDGVNLMVQGTLNTEANAFVHLEFFANSVCDDSGNGEGEIFLGATDLMTDGAGNLAFSSVFPAPAETFVATTATNEATGDTSEFSNCLQIALVVPTPSPSPSPTPEIVCEDGVDNDGDGAADCGDADCAGDLACLAAQEVCNNGADDDGDGTADCADPDCFASVFCSTVGISGNGCGLSPSTTGAGQVPAVLLMSLLLGGFGLWRRARG
jgi:hypothetical protein